MSRTVSPDGNNDVQFQERVEDIDGDTITLDSVELDKIDGVLQSGSDRNPPWLSYTETDNTLGGSITEKLVDITANIANLQGNKYTIKLVASDNDGSSPHFVDINLPLTAYDLSKASYSGNSFDISSQEANSTGIAWNDDGTKLFMIGIDSNSIHEYNLNVPYDITTMSYSGNSKSVSNQDTSPAGIAWNNNGTKAFVHGASTDYVYEYNASTAYDINTLSYSGDRLDFSQDSNMNDMEFSSDGTKMFGAGWGGNLIYIYDLSLAYSISNASYTGNTFDPSSESSEGTGIVAFSNDGTKMFVGNYFEMIYEYNLSTPYDTSTASYSGNSIDVGSEDGIIEDIEWNDNGTKFFMLGEVNNKIYEYNIS